MAIKYSKQVTVIETVIEDDVQSHIEYWTTDGAMRIAQFIIPKPGTVPVVLDLPEEKK